MIGSAAFANDALRIGERILQLGKRRVVANDFLGALEKRSAGARP
jgi:hypothetical protein